MALKRDFVGTARILRHAFELRLGNNAVQVWSVLRAIRDHFGSITARRSKIATYHGFSHISERQVTRALQRLRLGGLVKDLGFSMVRAANGSLVEVYKREVYGDYLGRDYVLVPADVYPLVMALDTRGGRRGGRTKGAGRPKGSRDKKPRVKQSNGTAKKTATYNNQTVRGSKQQSNGSPVFLEGWSDLSEDSLLSKIKRSSSVSADLEAPTTIKRSASNSSTLEAHTLVPFEFQNNNQTERGSQQSSGPVIFSSLLSVSGLSVLLRKTEAAPEKPAPRSFSDSTKTPTPPAPKTKTQADIDFEAKWGGSIPEWVPPPIELPEFPQYPSFVYAAPPTPRPKGPSEAAGVLSLVQEGLAASQHLKVLYEAPRAVKTPKPLFWGSGGLPMHPLSQDLVYDLPPPPRVNAAATKEQQLHFVAKWYRSAVSSRCNNSYPLRVAGETRKYLEDALEVFLATEIRPGAWVAWALDRVLLKLPANARTRYLPKVKQVFDPKLMTELRWAFRKVELDYAVAQVMKVPESEAFTAKSSKLMLEARYMPDRTDAKVQALVAHYFPEGWDVALKRVREKTAAARQEAQLRLQLGEWLWPLPRELVRGLNGSSKA